MQPFSGLGTLLPGCSVPSRGPTGRFAMQHYDGTEACEWHWGSRLYLAPHETRSETLYIYMYIYIYMYVCMYVCICSYTCLDKALRGVRSWLSFSGPGYNPRQPAERNLHQSVLPQSCPGSFSSAGSRLSRGPGQSTAQVH